jgi:diguanylate cyclase (GGDEF)-like protein
MPPKKHPAAKPRVPAIAAEVKVADDPVLLHPGRDAPRRKQIEYWLGHFSQFDLLTDLPNRSQFVDRLTGALARAVRSKQMVGVMLINLDRFKAINVELGHRDADRVLKTIGSRMKECTRASDTIARLGGDEFAVILEALDERQGATIAAERVLTALRAPIAVGGKEIVVTATAGVAFHPLDAEDIDLLLHRADLALSHAKDRQRGSFRFFSPDLALLSERDQQRQTAAMERLATLTPRELEVLNILVAGNANKMIAYMLGTSIRTIENHRARIMHKMQAHSLPELVQMVLEVRGVPEPMPALPHTQERRR